MTSRAGGAWRMEGASDLFVRIGDFLTQHRLSPDPVHYAFAHDVLSKPDSSLAREIAYLTDGGVRLTAASITALGGRVVPGRTPPAPPRPSPQQEMDAADDRAARLVAETQAQVDGFADMMRTMHDETRGFGRDLEQSAAAIERTRPSPELPGTHDVVRIAGAMIERARRSETKLAQATEEANALRAKLAEARETARRDPLTGLANRLAFAEGFAARDPAHGSHCIAMCDVDRFKRINDEHGHGVGDRVLKAIGRTQAERCDDHLVARHGGEEFAVLIVGMDVAEATALLDGARLEVAGKRFRDRETGEPLGTVTFSAGISAVRADESLESAIERADQLLYAAKAQGRNRICVD